MKFKGQTVRGKFHQYSLRQQLGEGAFSLIFSTQDPETICKVQVIQNPEILKAYTNQKEALKKIKHQNIVELRDSFEIQEKDGLFGFLLIERCSSGNVWNLLQRYGQNDVPEKIVLKIGYSVASALEYMHEKQISHRDIKLENVLINSRGEYKLCDFGSSAKQVTIYNSNKVIKKIAKQQRDDIQQDIQKTTTPFYRSPQQLDLYLGYEIGPKVDVFALGVLMFMLCFKKQPFQSRLSAINKQYFIPQQTLYSIELISIIEKCFTSNPINRIAASQLKEQLKVLMDKKKAHFSIYLNKQLKATCSQIAKITNQMLKSNTSIAQSSLFDKIKLIYSQMTTQTAGWIASFIQDNEEAPQLKYNRLILSKCWQKRYKVAKMYQILYKYTDDCKSKSLVNLKLLILLHNFMRKGPPQSIEFDEQYSSQKISSKIYKNWKLTQRPVDPDDIKRNAFVCLVIRYYSIVLLIKWKLCFENSDVIEGNFSILPFFRSKNKVALLKLPLISDMIDFLNLCVDFHEVLTTRSYLVEIQRSIILSLVDEEYCCISLLVFLICSFKQAVCHYSEELELEKVAEKISIVEKDFKNVFKKLSKLFDSLTKLVSLFQEETPLSLSPKILEHIKAINIREKKSGPFQLSKHINYERNIEGLKIPLSYEQAVKNPEFLATLEKKDSENAVYLDSFKINRNSNLEKELSSRTASFAKNQQKDQSGVTLQSFKKNKESKISAIKIVPVVDKNLSFVVNQQEKTKSNLRLEAVMMQFTHQNLNRDMNSKIREQKSLPSSKNLFNGFSDIVDGMRLNVKQSFVQAESPIVKLNDNKKKLFSKSSNFVGNDSAISSIQHTSQDENINSNIFQNPFQDSQVCPQSISNFNRPQKQFDAFKQIFEQKNTFNKMNKADTEEKIFSEVNHPQPQSSSLKNLNQRKKKSGSCELSSLQIISKQVYNTLNKATQENKKIQLMNFFDDQQEQKNQSINNQNAQLQKTEQADWNLKNKTRSWDFDEVSLIQSETPSRSCVDFKDFIVKEVKKNAEQYFIDFSTLKFFGKVGFGRSSQVFKGQWRGREVAIKQLKGKISPENSKQFQRQIMTSVKIRHHPNLVTLIGIAEYQQEYYIINQFCNGATLFDFLHESSCILSTKTKLSIAKQIARGMLFLHTNDPPIIHRDLKSLNVLLVNRYNGEAELQIKIADFGLSRDVAQSFMTGTLGTYVHDILSQHWMAPQIFNNQPYSLKADVYSYGIVLWQILSRCPPYMNIKNPQILMKFVTLDNGRPDTELIGSDCPEQIKFLMIRCWDRDPSNRPNFQQILDFLNSFN